MVCDTHPFMVYLSLLLLIVSVFLLVVSGCWGHILVTCGWVYPHDSPAVPTPRVRAWLPKSSPKLGNATFPGDAASSSSAMRSGTLLFSAPQRGASGLGTWDPPDLGCCSLFPVVASTTTGLLPKKDLEVAGSAQKPNPNQIRP